MQILMGACFLEQVVPDTILFNLKPLVKLSVPVPKLRELSGRSARGFFIEMNSEYKTSLEIRIDWADLDLFGHVNNVAFFKYVQAARVDYCESIGLTSLNEPGKNSFMVASSQCQFKKPILFPGSVRVLTKVEWIKNTSLQLAYKLLNQNNELVAEATDVIVVFDHHTKQKVQIDDQLKSIIEKTEGRQF
ncbi:MAG: acyl-CoA thioesterase [Bacteroidia bacterium]|nr:acyl-CoA thioesterase [Bacteroidia bacterium]